MKIKILTISIIGLVFTITTSCDFINFRNNSLGKVKLDYDNEDRVIAIDGPGRRKTTLDYDERGRIHNVINSDGEINYNYNSLDQLTQLKDNTGISNFEYDPNGRLAKMTYPQGDEIDYKYTESGDIASVSWGEKHYLKYERDLLGNIISMETPSGSFQISYDYNNRTMHRIYPNGAFSHFEYGENGRPVHIQHVTPDNNLALEYMYTYDDTGLMKTAYEWTRKGEVEINYTYDAYGQLLQAQYSDGRVYTYEYDMFGNCVLWSDPAGVSTATYNKLDQMTSLNGQKLKYDAAGNVTFLNSDKYEYNDSDELIYDGQNNYQYNALGLRVESQGPEETTEFLHLVDDLPYVLAETGDIKKQYLWADGQILGQINDDNSELFFFEDHLGSICAAVNKNGEIIGYVDFSPFGEPIGRIPNVFFGFAGEMQDETGKVFLRARYFDPNIKRFLSKDPVFPMITSGEKANKYSYTDNSPINYIDMDGRQKKTPEETNWPKDESKITIIREYIINEFKTNVVRYLESLPNKRPTMTDVKNARIYAYEKYVQEHSGTPIPFHRGVKYNNSILKRNTVIPSNIGRINFDWFASIGELGLGSTSSSYDLYLTWKKRWVTFTYLIRDKNSREIGPPQDHNAMVALELLKTGEISIEHLLRPEYKNDLNNFYNYRNAVNSYNMDKDFSNNFFLPLRSVGTKLPSNTFQHIDRPDELNKKNINDESKEITELIMSQVRNIQPIIDKYDISSGQGQVAGPGGYASSEAYAALNAFRESQKSGVPNVGGVYLDKAAEIIGELGSIDGIVFDPVSNRVILIGKGVEGTSLPALNLEDLATAYRTVYGDYVTEPGVTIDPDSQNPYSDSMNIVFFGGTEHTHFGHILLEADRQMKGLSLGEDNITHEKMNVNVNGYYNLLELGFSNLGGSYNKGLWSRFWLVPDRVIVKISDDNKSISFPDTRIRIKTETMRWQNGKLVPAKGQVDEKAEYFAAHFTKYYDEYAIEYPVYKELKDLTNLVGFLKWLKESGNPVDLGWLQKYEKPYNTPDKTPSLKVSDSRQTHRGGTQTISIFGGTDLTLKNNYVDDDGITKEYEEKAIIAVAGNPGVALGEFTANDGTIKKVLALPTSQTRSPGAKMINGNELRLITRLYCSFHNSQGPFGYSWEIDLPKLHITRPSRGEINYKIVGDQKVEIMNFHLTRPFGFQDVLFKKDAVDQQTRRIVFLPENQGAIKGLYPENGQYEVEYFNGKIEKYDKNGNISYIELAPDMYIKYLFNSLGKLESVILRENNKSVSTVKLFYDGDGRVTNAEVDGEVIQYKYDASGNLVRILQGDGTIDYFYNKQHLITEIHNNEEFSEFLEYDEFGRLQEYKTSVSESLPVGIQTVENETIITKSNGNEKTVSKYDAGGRLLEVDYGNGSLIRNKFHPGGSLAASDYTNHFGDKVTIEYSPDGRHVKHTDSEGHVRALLYNEFGQLLQVQNETNALLTKDYQLTTDGWMKSTEDSEKKVQVFQDKSSKPVKQVITAKNLYGGQLITELEYTNDKVIQQITNGLINDTRFFDNGKLVEQNFGKQKTSYSYDNNERLHMVSTSAGKIEVIYDPIGLIFQTDLFQGRFRETNSFQDGQLINRTSSLGLDDIFQYNEDGMLESLDRIDGEFWSIERDDKKTKFLRNNVLQLEFIWDKKGRLVQMAY
ncbi:hypothetical protein N9164_12085 [Draconibacterium sp.]|nr:hypothetical protein [Draconibacterium sp.]